MIQIEEYKDINEINEFLIYQTEIMKLFNEFYSNFRVNIDD